MMNIRWKTLIAVVISSSLLFGSTTAYAETNLEGDAFVPVKTVSNDIATITMNASDGQIYRMDKETNDWSPVGLTNEKNGFSQVYLFGDTFVVTSFFAVYLSKDAEKWEEHFVYAGEKFDPEEIIPDERFFSQGNMTADEIQRFLESKVDCKNNNCLPNYSEYTKNRAGRDLCKDYQGGKRESAATIIYKVSQACNIASEILITTLQKEQGLVTTEAPSSRAIRVAMGYGCPDTADCDKSFYGFQNQVWNAAMQLQNYRVNHEEFGWFPVGKPSNVPFQVEYRRNPSTGEYTVPTACGYSELTIKNAATSALYYYTPYQPNYAALKNLWGSGDECSAYGNRNFWRIYTFWFNDTRNYNVFIEKVGNKFVAIDSTGSISMSSDLKNWDYNVPMELPENTKIMSLDKSGSSLVASTTSSNIFMVSKDGVNWEKKETPNITTAPERILQSLTPHRIEVSSTAKKLDGKLKITIDGSEYVVIKVDEKNYQNGIIKLPSIIFNDGFHTVELEYFGDDNYMSEVITTELTVGTPKEAIYHLVSGNDTIQSIAALYNSSSQWIMEANGLNPSDILKAGSRLKVKYIYNMNLLDPSPVVEQFHTVMPGQSLQSIATLYDTSVTALKKINGLKSSIVYVGQSIRYA